jgi:hypothetical protein
VPVGACICPDAHCSATDGPAHHFGLCCAVSISLAKQQQWFSFCVLQARWSGSLRHACHDSAKRAQLVCGPQMHTFFPPAEDTCVPQHMRHCNRASLVGVCVVWQGTCPFFCSLQWHLLCLKKVGQTLPAPFEHGRH